jgi:hypothetical protein
MSASPRFPHRRGGPQPADANRTRYHQNIEVGQSRSESGGLSTLRSRRCEHFVHRLAGLVVAVLWLAAPLSAQAWAEARWEDSPRHLEWVTVKQGDREVRRFLVYPDAAEKSTAVVVIHEIFGLTDWVGGLADQLAEAGKRYKLWADGRRTTPRPGWELRS